MSPKEKAKELICKFQDLDIEVGGQYDGYITMKNEDAKQCALILCNEILSSGVDCSYKYDKSVGYIITYREFFQEVKQELNSM